MNRILAASLATLLALPGLASAQAHQVLVLKADGSADTATRTRIENEVLKLAKNLDGNVVLGEITYADAAAATGCKPEIASCRDEVMATLSVDEIIITTANTSGGELRVDVKVAAKGQPLKDTATTVASIDQSNTGLDAALGPMFGVKVATPPTPPVDHTPPTPPGPAIVDHNPDKQPIDTRLPTGPTDPYAPTTTPVNPTTTPTDPNAVTAAPNNVVGPSDIPPDHRKLEKIGVGVAGGLVVFSFLLWGAASSTQSQIESQPTNTPADFKKLKSLEDQGDAQAGAGNFMFVSGLVLGGVSGYYLWRDHKAAKAHEASLRISPAVVGRNGAGLTLTFGGSP